ncbi:hypothetical protein ACERIM_10760 [Natrinema sp. H-ect1]|uniref:hypothetical protein n=1 Tax=Natrinema sp. H-ect1 TaxID=3242700 RepID=UPI00359DE45B
MNALDSVEEVDPETFIRKNREKVLAVIRQSDDPFARACAWTLLDRYTPDKELDRLHDELDTVIKRE